MICTNCRDPKVPAHLYTYGVRTTHLAALCSSCATVLTNMGMDLRERRPRPARDLTGWIHPGGVA